MTRPILSVLDPSPIFEGKTGSDAIADTIALSKATEALGYRSYWVQEHHNAPCFASVSPEVLLAALGAHTSHIKLGSGGVMLPNYSPLKVAEQFNSLEALYRGRIELGLGRATGADPRASAALLGPGANEFPKMLRLLLHWLLDASGEVPLPAQHPARGIKANPTGRRPDVWMLSSSPQSAAFAGQMGLKLSFADFLSPGGAKSALDAYRASFQPSQFASIPHTAVGLVALVAETEERATELSKSALAWNLRRAQGDFALFPSVSVANTMLDKVSPDTISNVSQRSISGTTKSVAHQLRKIAADADVDEFFILTIAETLDDRIRSYELLANEMLG